MSHSTGKLIEAIHSLPFTERLKLLHEAAQPSVGDPRLPDDDDFFVRWMACEDFEGYQILVYFADDRGYNGYGVRIWTEGKQHPGPLWYAETIFYRSVEDAIEGAKICIGCEQCATRVRLVWKPLLESLLADGYKASQIAYSLSLADSVTEVKGMSNTDLLTWSELVLDFWQKLVEEETKELAKAKIESNAKVRGETKGAIVS